MKNTNVEVLGEITVRLLIIEADPEMRQLLSERMQMEQFITDSCSDGVTAYEY